MKQLPNAPPTGSEFLPVVTVCRNLTRFAADRSIALARDADEFDAYTLAYLETTSGCRFLLLHYAGSDEKTFDIWLPTDVADYRQCLNDIIVELKVSRRDIIERKLSENAFQRRTAV